MVHISLKEFQTINWLPIKERLNQCLHYLNEVVVKSPESGLSLRNSYHKLKQPFGRTSIGQSALPLIGPALWNKDSRKKLKEQLASTYLNINLRNTI